MCSNTMDEVYENINDCNPSKKRKNLITLDDMIVDIMTSTRFKAIIKELLHVENQIFHFFLSYNLIFLFQKVKFNALFHHENKQQKKITKYCI